MKPVIYLATLCIASHTAMAAESAASDPGTQAVATALPAKKLDVAVGLMVRVGPDYLGSQNTSAQPVPMVRISYASDMGTLRLGSLPGSSAPMLSFSPIDTDSMTLGVGIGMDPGRSEGTAGPFKPGSERLKGMGDLDSTSVVALFGRYKVAGVALHGQLRSAIDTNSGHGGQLAYVGASYALPMQGPVTANVSAGVTWANERYMQNMFGVTAMQSSNSGFRVYSPGAGIRDLSLGLDLHYPLSQRIVLHGGVSITRLLGDAANSPLVENDMQPQAHAGLTYHW